jgi:hypothetical protein
MNGNLDKGGFAMRGMSRVELYGTVILSPDPESGELVVATTSDCGTTRAMIAVSHDDSVHRDFWQIKIENKSRNAQLNALQKTLHSLTAGETVKVVGEPYIESGRHGKIPVVKPTDIRVLKR